MKKLALLLLTCLMTAQLMAADEQWGTDFAKAEAQAKKEKKPVLLDFTGSDWCPPCMKLKKDVFSSKEFLEFAKKNLILVELDFPQDKPQTPDLKRTNQELSEKFKIEGYPTIIVLNSEGKEINRTVGYGGESAKDYVAKLEKVLKK